MRARTATRWTTRWRPSRRKDRRTPFLSKVDETVKLGPAIDALIRHQMVLRA